MTNRTDTAIVAPRKLTCEGCGTPFSCDVSGDCWCMAEPVILPLPTTGGDCLCRECLRKAAIVGARS